MGWMPLNCTRIESLPPMNSTHDLIFSAFLRRQYEEGMALMAASDILKLMPLSGPVSDRYIAEFNSRGLIQDEAGNVVEFNRFAVGIWFPEDYLRRVDVSVILSYLGPAPRPFHPNCRPPYLCLFIRPGTSLVDILHSCYELFSWQLWNTADEGLNHEASQWARQRDPSWFPIDRRPLRRRPLRLEVTPVVNQQQP